MLPDTVHPSILGVLTVLTVYMKIGFKMRVPASFVNISGKYEKQKLKIFFGKIFVYLIIFKVGFELFFSLTNWLVLLVGTPSVSGKDHSKSD